MRRNFRLVLALIITAALVFGTQFIFFKMDLGFKKSTLYYGVSPWWSSSHGLVSKNMSIPWYPMRGRVHSFDESQVSEVALHPVLHKGLGLYLHVWYCLLHHREPSVQRVSEGTSLFLLERHLSPWSYPTLGDYLLSMVRLASLGSWWI
jgi:hypothetical protein